MKLNKVLKHVAFGEYKLHVPSGDLDINNIEALYYDEFKGLPSCYVIKYKTKDTNKFLKYITDLGYKINRFVHDTSWDNTNGYYFTNVEKKSIIHLVLRDDTMSPSASMQSMLAAGFTPAQEVNVTVSESGEIASMIFNKLGDADQFSSENSESLSTVFIYVDITQISKEQLAENDKLISTFTPEKKKKTETDKTSSVFMFEVNENRKLTISPHEITGYDINIDEHYNADFAAVDKKIKEWIVNFGLPNKRLLLLNGIHGSGKTNYIKSLLNINEDIKKIYVPPQFINDINDPGFFAMLKRYTNSVIILEDAEKLLIAREHNGNADGVSVLLNLTDGMLASVLNFKVITTFNVDEKEIDQALKRKGRLFMKYTFNKLTADKTSNLYKKLYNKNAPEKEMTLAEIFEAEDNGEVEKKETRMGFGFGS